MGVKLKIKKSIFRLPGNHKWYVEDVNDPRQMTYLSQDGTLGCDRNEEGHFDHLWFKTREAARQAVRLYKAKNDPQFEVREHPYDRNQFWVNNNFFSPGERDRYLQIDGTLYYCTKKDGQPYFTGYFPSREDAYNRIMLYRKLNKSK